jgi:pimeloyl-ACP methyl ester carboxylesterase
MTSSQASPIALEQLFHLSLNEDKPTTVLLLHGLMSSHREWAAISPSLSDYHLLIPDLPGHCSSAHLRLSTLSTAADLVAKLIRAYSHNSTCHVVGFSGGGFIAVELANKCPDLVQSLFVSGVVSNSVQSISKSISSSPEEGTLTTRQAR